MTRDAFENEMLAHLRRRPFEPFFVSLTSGTRLLIDDYQAVAVNGGTAGFIKPDGEPVLFDCESVNQITPITYGAAS